MFEIEYPDTSKVEFNNNYWIGLYLNSEEAITSNAPVHMNNSKLWVSVMMDASHASDLITSRIFTGFLIVVGQNIVKWYSIMQNNVETSTQRSKLVVLQIAIKALTEVS